MLIRGCRRHEHHQLRHRGHGKYEYVCTNLVYVLESILGEEPR